MGKMSVICIVGVLMCVVEQCMGMGTYYWAYPETQGALNYPAPYEQYAPQYAIVPVECEEKEEESSSESSSEETKEEKEKKEESDSKEETKEGETKEGESKEEEAKEEGEPKEGESKEGESKEGESKEGESKEGESKEEKESKEEPKKKEKKEKREKKFFAYAFPPSTIPQYVYSSPMMSYRGYVQQPMNYPTKSSYYSLPAASAVKGYPSAPVARVVSSPMRKYVSPMSYTLPVSNGYSYWGPSGGAAYYRY